MIYVNANIDSELKETDKYFGNYLGIVIQNNDPDKAGKIKIWVPHISPTVYKNWDEKNEDKSFKFIGRNIDSDITDILEELKIVVPWAECASPLIGSIAPARYNAYDETATISDSNRSSSSYPTWSATGEEPTGSSKSYKLNDDGIGEKPARKYEHHSLKVADAFANKDEIRFNNVNKYSYGYVPTSYSNSAKGSFGIPNVGAHVWVFFASGDPNNPVYFATTYGEDEWKSIYTSDLDYPGTYENKSQSVDPTYNHNTETYRNKYVINQKGGTIEIVNTDNKEALKLTHYSGSFKEFNNDVSIEFATHNNQKLVLSDEFFTVKGAKNDYVGMDYDQIINGDYYKKIGNLNRDYQKQWRDLMEDIADAKQLFEIKRTDQWSDPNDFIKKTSGIQSKSGTHGPCPLCKKISLRDKIWSNIYTFGGVDQYAVYDSDNFAFDHDQPSIDISDLIVPTSSAKFLGTDPCPVCGGTGLSPSSRDGNWLPETQKETAIISNLQTKIQDIVNIEKKLGLGGSEIVNITKHKIENIGLMYNDFPSIRIDEVGKIENYEVRVFNKGVTTTKKESALIEYVHIDDFPGGDLTQTIGNKWNVLVGSGGVSLKSTGGVDIGGTVTNIAGQQVNISSEYEINISSKRVSIAAEMLTLRNKSNRQVLIDGNLGVNQNIIINGGAHVEGELSVHHVSAPVEIQETEPIILFSRLLAGLSFDVDFDLISHNRSSKNVGSGTMRLTLTNSSNDNKVEAYPHTHPFKNLPLKLYATKDDVRDVGKMLNRNYKVAADPVTHEKKGAETR